MKRRACVWAHSYLKGAILVKLQNADIKGSAAHIVNCNGLPPRVRHGRVRWVAAWADSVAGGRSGLAARQGTYMVCGVARPESKAVRQRCGRRLVDDAEDVQAGHRASVHCCL
jgi:hypothetical protein